MLKTARIIGYFPLFFLLTYFNKNTSIYKETERGKNSGICLLGDWAGNGGTTAEEHKWRRDRWGAFVSGFVYDPVLARSLSNYSHDIPRSVKSLLVEE